MSPKVTRQTNNCHFTAVTETQAVSDINCYPRHLGVTIYACFKCPVNKVFMSVLQAWRTVN